MIASRRFGPRALFDLFAVLEPVGFVGGAARSPSLDGPECGDKCCAQAIVLLGILIEVPGKPDRHLRHGHIEYRPAGEDVGPRERLAGVCQRLHGHGRVDQYNGHDDRCQQEPANAPIERHMPAGHELDVDAQILQAVKVEDADQLEDAEHEYGQRAAEIVHQRRHPLAALRNVRSFYGMQY